MTVRIRALDNVCQALNGVICSTNYVHDQGGSNADGLERHDDPGVGTAVWRRVTGTDDGRLSPLRRGRHRATRGDALARRERGLAAEPGGAAGRDAGTRSRGTRGSG